MRPFLSVSDLSQLREIGCVRQRDDGEERRADLDRARQALLAAQVVVLEVHRKINLIDAVQAMETALADVEFEEERIDV